MLLKRIQLCFRYLDALLATRCVRDNWHANTVQGLDSGGYWSYQLLGYNWKDKPLTKPNFL